MASRGSDKSSTEQVGYSLLFKFSYETLNEKLEILLVAYIKKQPIKIGPGPLPIGLVRPDQTGTRPDRSAQP